MNRLWNSRVFWEGVCWFEVAAATIAVPFTLARPYEKFAFNLVGCIGASCLIYLHRPDRRQQTSFDTPDDRTKHLESQIEELHRQLEQERERIAQAESGAIEYQSQLIEKLQKQTDEELSRFQSQWDERETRFSEELEATRELYESQITQLQSAVRALNAPRPFQSVSRLAYAGNQIIGYFSNRHQVVLDAHETDSSPRRDYIWLSPRIPLQKAKFKVWEGELQQLLGLPSEPTIDIDRDGLIKISFSRLDDREKTPEPTIAPPPRDWFRRAIESSNHYFVNGDTGSGKSTLIANIIGMASSILGEDTEIIIIDPKYPDSDWHIEPKYKGYEESAEGAKAMAQDVTNRLSEAREAADNGMPIPRRIPRFYIIDEAEDLIAFDSSVGEAIKSTLRVGRSTNTKCLFIGQSPNCSDYKLRKANFNNTTQFFLRDNAKRGISDLSPNNEIRADLSEQYALYMKAANGKRENNFEMYYGLIKFQGQSPFMAYLPEPNHWRKVLALAPSNRPIAPPIAPVQNPEPPGANPDLNQAEPDIVNRLNKLYEGCAADAPFEPNQGDRAQNGDSEQSIQRCNFTEPSIPCDPMSEGVSQIERDWVLYLWGQQIRAQAKIMRRVWGVPRGNGKRSIAAKKKLDLIKKQLDL